MISRRALIFAVLAVAVAPFGVKAADSSPKGFLEAIYNTYRGKNSKGIALDTDAAARRYFAPKLAALIIKDRKDAARKGDIPTLDGDPFINAQDWEIKSFDISVHDVAGDTAAATVKFDNLGVKTTLEIDLVKLKDGWRIAEISFTDGTLSGLFSAQ